MSPYVEGFGVAVMAVMTGPSSALLSLQEIFVRRDDLASMIFVKLLPKLLSYTFESGRA